MEWGLFGRVALVTGGSSGIGLSVAKVLAGQGARVVIAARRTEVLERAAGEIEQDTGRRVLALSVDTTVQEQVDELIAQIKTHHGRIEILVNCAANPSGLVRNEIQFLDDGALLQDLNTKVVGYARCAKHRWPDGARIQHHQRHAQFSGVPHDQNAL
jgi:NAD(P)-dependent dehydrogenase (short-subunit alcohol dehydrogenase family)